MHQFGLGTWLSEPNTVQAAVEYAIDIGYRHIDCAWLYGNEEEVGRAIQAKLNDGTIKRKELFITSKLWNIFHDPKDIQDAFQQTLDNLKLSYIDLYLMHYPTGWVNINQNPFPLEGRNFIASEIDYVDTWHALEELPKQGSAVSIGVSNFNSFQIERLVQNSKSIIPVTNQIEVNPYLTNVDVVNTCARLNITVTAYSPLGNPSKPETRSWKGVDGVLIDDAVVLELSEKYGKTPAQILIRHALDRGLIVIPKSVTPERIKSNAEIFDFRLSEAEVEKLNGLNCDFRVVSVGANRNHKYYPFNAEYTE